MNKSKYLEAFKKLADESKDAYELVGDCLLVENIPPEEIKTKSGIILGVEPADHRKLDTIASNKPIFVHVLAVGEGYYNDETKESVPLSVQPGDIILVGLTSVKWFSTLSIDGYQPFEVGLTRESEIQIRFKGQEGYNRATETINRGLKKAVEG